MTATPALADRAAELRRAFDQSFAEPVAPDAPETIALISIRIGGEIRAIRMDDIAGLYADVAITPCPGPVAELCGIAGFRGVLMPVYDLPALLGHPRSNARWLVLARDRMLALAFETFDGHYRVEPAALAAQPVIDIPALVAAIKDRAAAIPHKEH